MTNLIIDTQNLFFRSLFIVGGYSSKNYTFDSQFEIDQLMRKVSTDVSFIIRQFNPSRVIFTFDSRSWRKKIQIDENDGYKANREKKGIINWDNVFNTMKEFGDIMSSNGFIVTKIDDAEADDLITLWRDELIFNQNQHVVIVSSDEDVRQLVHFYPYNDDKICFCLVYNPFSSGKNSRKIYIPEHFENWLNTEEQGDIFNRAIDVDKQDFKRLKNEKIIFDYIDGNEIGLKKMFCGDDGDNIPSIYSWIDQKEKVCRITESKFKKIRDSLNLKSYLDVIPNANAIYDMLCKFSGSTPPFKIKDQIERQIKLVILNRSIFPNYINQKFDEHCIEQLKKPNSQNSGLNMNNMLSGTRYVKNSHLESSIFKETDLIISKLF